jgi:hypothetical protein
MYLRTPSLHKPHSIWPTPADIGISKDVWMLGIGLSLLADRAADNARLPETGVNTAPRMEGSGRTAAGMPAAPPQADTANQPGNRAEHRSAALLHGRVRWCRSLPLGAWWHARRSTVPRFHGDGQHRPARHQRRQQHGETSIWLAGYLIDGGVLVSIDNCDRVESLSALPRRLPVVLP